MNSGRFLSLANISKSRGEGLERTEVEEASFAPKMTNDTLFESDGSQLRQRLPSLWLIAISLATFLMFQGC